MNEISRGTTKGAPGDVRSTRYITNKFSNASNMNIIAASAPAAKSVRSTGNVSATSAGGEPGVILAERISAPAPFAIRGGTTPKMKAKEVIEFACKRNFVADLAALLEQVA